MKMELGNRKEKLARVKRAWGVGVIGLIAVMGALLFLALLPRLPSMLWGTLQGDAESARALFGYIGGVGICCLAWHWREAICPQLRRDARK